MSRISWLVIAGVLSGACGRVGPSESTTPRSAPAPTWEELTPERLRDYVQREAEARIAELQPNITIEDIAATLESPAAGTPDLSGRTVERLFDLVAVELAAGRHEEAARLVRAIRARARNRNSAFAGTTFLAEAARRHAGDEVALQEAAIAEVFRELPRARFGSATVVFRLFQNPQQLEARVEQTKGQLVSLETAGTVLVFSQVLPEVVRHRDRFLAAIENVQAEHEAEAAPEPYPFSTIDISRNRRAVPVTIAVWDVGTNPDLFADQLFRNRDEEPNGQDDDGNGQVDDISGIVSDVDAPHTELLFEPTAEIVEEYWTFLKGIMDLRAGLAATPDAQRVLELVGSVTDAEELEALERNLDAIGEWAHGTHVAGLMVAGNPFARLAVFRSAWAGETRTYYRRGPTDEELDLEQRNVEAIAEFINRHDIKVVNASLGFSTDYLEDQLRHEQERYSTDEAVRARAREVHARREANWRYVFEQCPDTLFVVAAGNSNRDVVEYHDIPAALELPNVMAVGAVDRWGNWATFTNSSPARVTIFDFGVEVPSLLPNGETVPLSGTSMASPNAANLAGKMYTLNPELTPPEVISIIVATGDPIDAPFNGRIANEEAALERVLVTSAGAE